jgi:hypothetical protein
MVIHCFYTGYYLPRKSLINVKIELQKATKLLEVKNVGDYVNQMINFFKTYRLFCNL